MPCDTFLEYSCFCGIKHGNSAAICLKDKKDYRIDLNLYMQKSFDKPNKMLSSRSFSSGTNIELLSIICVVNMRDRMIYCMWRIRSGATRIIIISHVLEWWNGYILGMGMTMMSVDSSAWWCKAVAYKWLSALGLRCHSGSPIFNKKTNHSKSRLTHQIISLETVILVTNSIGRASNPSASRSTLIIIIIMIKSS